MFLSKFFLTNTDRHHMPRKNTIEISSIYWNVLLWIFSKWRRKTSPQNTAGRILSINPRENSSIFHYHIRQGTSLHLAWTCCITQKTLVNHERIPVLLYRFEKFIFRANMGKIFCNILPKKDTIIVGRKCPYQARN